MTPNKKKKTVCNALHYNHVAKIRRITLVATKLNSKFNARLKPTSMDFLTILQKDSGTVTS